jgi:hypothetical protein
MSATAALWVRDVDPNSDVPLVMPDLDWADMTLLFGPKGKVASSSRHRSPYLYATSDLYSLRDEVFLFR